MLVIGCDLWLTFSYVLAVLLNWLWLWLWWFWLGLPLRLFWCCFVRLIVDFLVLGPFVLVLLLVCYMVTVL